MTARLYGDMLILLAAFIWGVAFYFQKVAMLDIGPLLFLGMRGFVAALVLLPFLFREQRQFASQLKLAGAGWCCLHLLLELRSRRYRHSYGHQHRVSHRDVRDCYAVSVLACPATSAWSDDLAGCRARNS